VLDNEDSELLSTYADKELSGRELSLVQERLAASAEWREELERLKRAKTLLASLPHLSAPADLLDRLEREANRSISRNRFSLWPTFKFPGFFNSWAVSGALAGAAVLLVFVHVRQTQKMAFIPLEPLLAAHSRGQTAPYLLQRLTSASEYSSQLKNHAQS